MYVCACVYNSEVGLCGFVCLLKTGSKEVKIYRVSGTIEMGGELFFCEVKRGDFNSDIFSLRRD